MYFQSPEAFWLLALVVPLAAALLLLSFWRRLELRKQWGEERLIHGSSSRLSILPYLIRAVTVCLGLAALVASLARPVLEHGQAEFPQGTTDVIVIVDVSRSMAALDYKGKMPSGSQFPAGTRLDMAKHLIMTEVVPALGANRFGIVTYAGEALPLAFLTLDAGAVDWVHRRAMTPSSAPGNGSSMAKAFHLCYKLFDLDSPPGNKRVVVLFSDGGNDDGLDMLNQAVAELKARDIELVVVGVGRTIPSAIPVSQLSPRDQREFYNKEFYEVAGEVVTTQLDENALRILANRSGGKYVRVNSVADFSFNMLAQRLEMKHRPGKQELFMWPLAAGLLLLAAGWLATSQYVQAWWFQSPRNSPTSPQHPGRRAKTRRR